MKILNRITDGILQGVMCTMVILTFTLWMYDCVTIFTPAGWAMAGVWAFIASVQTRKLETLEDAYESYST